MAQRSQQPATPAEEEAPGLAGTGANLYQRMAAVQAEAGSIRKKKKAELNYAFVSWDAVAEELQGVTARHGLVVIPSIGPEDWTVAAESTSTGKNTWRATVNMTLTWINADKPTDQVTTFWPGIGDDVGDKALQKAGTYAEKYALMKTFLISGDDTDETGKQSEHDDTQAVPSGPRGRAGGGQKKLASRHGCPDCGGGLEIVYNPGKRAFVGHSVFPNDCKWRPEWSQANAWISEAEQEEKGSQPAVVPAQPAAAEAQSLTEVLYAKSPDAHGPAGALATIDQWSADRQFLEAAAMAVLRGRKLSEQALGTVCDAAGLKKRTVAAIRELELASMYRFARELVAAHFAAVAAEDPQADQPGIPFNG